jgi:hypothetical protein
MIFFDFPAMHTKNHASAFPGPQQKLVQQSQHDFSNFAACPAMLDIFLFSLPRWHSKVKLKTGSDTPHTERVEYH